MRNLIYFCFNYSAEDIKQDYFRNGHSTIIEKIQLEKKFGNCRLPGRPLDYKFLFSVEGLVLIRLYFDLRNSAILAVIKLKP